MRTEVGSAAAAALAAILLIGSVAHAAAPKPKAKPPRPTPGAVEPWDLAAEPRTFEDVCFQDRSALLGLSEREARELLEPVPGQGLNLNQQPYANRRMVRFQGVAKLRTWAPDAALRLSFVNLAPIKVHVWGSGSSVSLYYYGWPRPMWYAYRKTYRPGEPRQNPRPDDPPGVVLLTTDDGRASRLPGETYELRCQDGAVVLSKGDMRLLTAPLAGAAAAVYLESSQGVGIRDLALCRSGPAPEDPLRPHRLVQTSAPDTLDWTERVAETARFQRLPEGRVALSAGKATAVALATVPLPRAGLIEVIAEVENVTPGTGLFFADDQGQPLQGVEFSRELSRSYVVLMPGKPGNMPWPPTLQLDNVPAPYIGERHWLRLVAGGGVLKCWSSGDGVHWGQALDPQPVSGACRRFGMYVQAGGGGSPSGIPETRRVQLRTLQVRQLDGLTAMTSEELLEQAVAVGPVRPETDKDLGAWQERVSASIPAGADPAAWRLACAVHALAANPGPEIAKPLLDAMVRDGLARSASFQARLRLLQDAALVWDAWKEEDARRYAAHWERLGQGLLADGASADFDLLRRSFLAASLWTQNLPNPRIESLSPTLARDRLLVLLGQQRWRELHQASGQIKFWRQPSDPAGVWPSDQEPLQRMLAWLDAETGGGQAGPVAVGTGSRRPLVAAINRDAYNIFADLQTAADDQQYGDAARVLTATAAPSGTGMVPDARDFQLFTSFPTAVTLLMHRHPPLQQVIGERLKGADQLRVQQALAQGNAAVIEGLSVQYYGTPAAAAANLWLGDRLLSGGDFARALARYQQALATAESAQQHQVAARARLAAAMLGRRVGEPPSRPVTFGETQVSPAQFEKWVAEMIDRSKAGPGETPLAPTAAVINAASPGIFDAKTWGKFEGDVGQAANEIPPQAQGADWPARQLSAMVAGEVMLVSNRFQVTAFDLASGRQRWNSALGGTQGRTHGWSLLPMRPLVAGNRIYARLLPQSARPEIACIELATGKKLWQRGCTGEIISDPLIVQGRLFALVSELPPGQLTSQLLLVEFVPESGEVLNRRLLFDLLGPWAAQQGCQATVLGGRIVAALAGAVFSLDPDEQVSWVRYSPNVPPAADPSPGQQYFQPPLVAGERLYVSQPGTRSIECIELETGRLLWRRALAGVRRLLGGAAVRAAGSTPAQSGAEGLSALAGTRLLVQTVDGVLALSADTGQTLWQRELPRTLEGYALARPALLLCAQREAIGSGEKCPVLTWIDTADGRIVARSPLWSLRSKQAMLGPIVAHGSDVWCFTDVTDPGGALQPQRNIVKLSPTGPAQGFVAAGTFWTAGMDPGLSEATDLVLPGWAVLSAQREDSQGVRREWSKAQNVLATRSHVENMRLARWVTVPAGTKPQLLMEVGCDPNSDLTVEVRANGRKLHSLAINEKADTWKTAVVDLSSCAGRSVLLTVATRSPGFAWTYWKRLEVR